MRELHVVPFLFGILFGVFTHFVFVFTRDQIRRIIVLSRELRAMRRSALSAGPPPDPAPHTHNRA